MNRNVLIFTVVAVFSLVVMVMASAVAVFAFTMVEDPAPVEVMPLEDAPVHVAPVEAEVAAPEFQAEKASYQGGCPYSHSKMQLTEAPAQQVVDEGPLAQITEQ
ncbi:MAG: hypothetical protein KDJ65_24190 [Anaerolineae bacterium]|nr:hypothetical protein [Anaerolineae bacterium]